MTWIRRLRRPSRVTRGFALFDQRRHKTWIKLTRPGERSVAEGTVLHSDCFQRHRIAIEDRQNDIALSRRKVEVDATHTQ